MNANLDTLATTRYVRIDDALKDHPAWAPERPAIGIPPKLTDAELQAKTAEFKKRIENGETLDDLLPEAFAVAREGAWRVLSQRPFDVQLMGGATLHFGLSLIHISEPTRPY